MVGGSGPSDSGWPLLHSRATAGASPATTGQRTTNALGSAGHRRVFWAFGSRMGDEFSPFTCVLTDMTVSVLGYIAKRLIMVLE